MAAMVRGFCIAFGILCCVACKQSSKLKNLEITNDTIENKTNYSNYYMEINSRNCNFEIRTNGFLTRRFFENKETYSNRFRIDYEMSDSNKQYLHFAILPNKCFLPREN